MRLSSYWSHENTPVLYMGKYFPRIYPPWFLDMDFHKLRQEITLARLLGETSG